MSTQSLREEITAKIIAALEKDLLPWRRTWVTNDFRHSNIVSKKTYTGGMNPILLDLHAQQHGFQSNWWGTFNQWKNLGCLIKRRPTDVEPGQWGCGILAYIPITKEVAHATKDKEEEETFWLPRKFTVFNAQQVTGSAAEQYQEVKIVRNALPDYEPAEALIQATGAEIRFGGDRAYYHLPTPANTFPNHKDGDFIQVPHKSSFINGGYYSTILHEMSHWAEVRLGWDRDKNGYAMGELIAEIASCYLAGELGVPNSDGIDNHASYLKSWLEGMRNDASYIFTASKQASKVCDYLLSFVRTTEAVPTPELVDAA